MTYVMKFKKELGLKFAGLSARHPYAALALAFVGMPACLLLGVSFMTALFAFPLGLLSGWF